MQGIGIYVCVCTLLTEECTRSLFDLVTSVVCPATEACYRVSMWWREWCYVPLGPGSPRTPHKCSFIGENGEIMCVTTRSE